MALSRRFLYKKPPDQLLELSERVYVFDCCFSSHVMGEGQYKVYLRGIVAQLRKKFSYASFMVFNFRQGEKKSQVSDVLSQYDITVMDYPWPGEGCPLLPFEMIHHFLRSTDSWLTLGGQQNVVLMHCERGGWPVLAFMLSGLLLYRNQYHGEQKTLEMVQNHAPKELLHLLSPLNPQPSQLRYLQYISRRNLGSDWPPSDTPLLLDCLILRGLPNSNGRKGCRPVLWVYGHDPKARTNRSSVLLFSTPRTEKHARLYRQKDSIVVKLDIQCGVQGDVSIECLHLDDDLVGVEMVFRIIFHTAFVRENTLIVQRDGMDILGDANNQFPTDFKAELIFSGADALVPTITTAPVRGGAPTPPPPTFGAGGAAVVPNSAGRRALQGSVGYELQRHGEEQIAPEFDVSKLEALFSATVLKLAGKSRGRRKPKRVELIDRRRANNTEIMLTKVKMPLPDMMAAVLAMDDSVLDDDQIDNLIKFCPTKEEMDLLKNYPGDKATLGKCEQYFMELMKAPRVETKLRVFSFKIQFGTQITEFKQILNVVNSACEEVRTSQKLEEIMKNILYLDNTMNQGIARGAAVGFKLKNLLKLSYTHSPNSKMTLMDYLCKVLNSKAPVLLDFHKDLESLESASEIQLKSLAEEMQAIAKGLDKLNKELAASESDGPVSDVFRRTLKDFISIVETEVATVSSLYSVVGRNADELVYYFGEDPNQCSFEQVTATLLNFIREFKKVHKQIVKQAVGEEESCEGIEN